MQAIFAYQSLSRTAGTSMTALLVDFQLNVAYIIPEWQEKDRVWNIKLKT